MKVFKSIDELDNYYFYKHFLLFQNVLKEIIIINNKKKYYEYLPINYDNIDDELYLDPNINYII
jgi:hypothetical protein